MFPYEGLSVRPLDFRDLISSSATTTATITITATPAPMPAFAPVPSPPDGLFSDIAGVEVGTSEAEETDIAGVEVDNIEVDNIEAEEEGVAEETVDVGPTVAAISNILLSSLQQVFCPQHQFLPPQFHTPTLPHLSSYCVGSLATHPREA
jgi:hypothetical protein